MSFMLALSWRLVLGVPGIPLVFYLLCAFFYLPESPRWLVSKGKMSEAKKALKRLRGIEDVSGEMALLVEGLGVGGETSIREYIIGPGDEHKEDQEGSMKAKIKLCGAEEGLSWIAKPLTGETSPPGLTSQHGSVVNQSLVDPVVILFRGVQEKQPEQGSMRSAHFPNYGSMYSATGAHSQRDRHVDEKTEYTDGDDYQVESAGEASDADNLEAALILQQATTAEKDMTAPPPQGSVLSLGVQGSLLQASGETVGSTGIDGSWQLAWTLDKKEDSEEGKNTGDGFKGMYLHLDRGSVILPPGGGEDQEEGNHVQACKQACYVKEGAHGSTSGRSCHGINGVVYYIPQVLEEARVEALLADVAIIGKSASFMFSALTTFLMLPCIGVAMKLMDISGRSSLLLATIPVLVVSLIILLMACTINMSYVLNAVISTVCLIVYFCTFVMAYGPIPNILCSEIFPTRVRGVCFAICSLVFWIGNIIVCYTLPLLLRYIGLGGIFAIYATVCVTFWVFVYLKVPVTKGMPLEIITEFFVVGSQKSESPNKAE
ncbi:hypothetical protein Cgig2_026691 [Carnegiea gigantea]|uniref:Major facilitator superfamily (MFS) profile domain-containing protein n=1 Tax=Carnegiea gigantea TaxID=171969 RepID=A0A9Q1JHE1_9CARY|nr:hypothetical protein Cgig2_026691 [Carnegiea gigantea]